jgi:hypothetical protein
MRPASPRLPAEGEERLACAVLAAQAAALRDRIESGSTVEMLWNASDVVGGLVKLVREQASTVALDPALAAQYETTLSMVLGVSDTLDDLAFVQAQRVDFARQMADCVVHALERLALADAPPGARLLVDELEALYVSEEQRRVHGDVASRFLAEAGAEAGAAAPLDGERPPLQAGTS